ncbi:MAG: hypothetical protein P8Y62_05245 [candidate division WOR-3 bacterium]
MFKYFTKILYIFVFINLFSTSTYADTFTTKQHEEKFCHGRKHFLWTYTPKIVKSGTKEQLVIEETFEKLKDEFSGLVGEMEHCGPYGSIVSTRVTFKDGSSVSVQGNIVDLDGRTITGINTEHKYIKTWQTSWSNVSIEGEIDVLELYISDHLYNKIDSEIMRGESFLIVLVVDAICPSAPVAVISADEKNTISTELFLDNERSDEEKKVYVSSRLVLETSVNGGTFSNLGTILTAECEKKKIGLPIKTPEIEIRVVPANRAGPASGLSSLLDDEEFYVEAHVPRTLITVKKLFGNTLNVELKSKGTGSSDNLELKSLDNFHGRIVYRNEQKASLNKGSKGAFINYMDPISITPYDELTITLEEDPNVKLIIGAYSTETQRAIMILRQRFVLMRDFFWNGIQNPDISKTSKEMLHRKYQVAKNAITIMDYNRETNDNETWNDWKKLAIAMEYNKLLLQDASEWVKTGEALARDNRFDIAVSWIEEQKAIITGYQNSAKRTDKAYEKSQEIIFEGVYKTIITFTGANQMHTAILGQDGFGRKVDLTERILAGVEVASAAILMGANTLRPKGPMAPGAKGINAFYNKSGGTRLLNRGIRAEDWLVEVYGTGRRGGSQTTLKAGNVSRKYDAYNHVQNIALESKTGKTGFSGHTKTEFLNDVEMLKRHNELKKVEWHFFVSEEVYRKNFAKGLRGEELLKTCFGPNVKLLEELKKVEAELRALGKEFNFVFHENLAF